MARTTQREQDREPVEAPAQQRDPRPSPAAGGQGVARERGALLRRLLATGDWLALIAALLVATAATSTTDIATLFWAVLFSPVWFLALKLHGLYDNDHRRIRHSTLDEVPSLISASVIGVLALDGLLALSPVGALSPGSAILVGVGILLGSFVSRSLIRFCWHRLTPIDVGLVIGRPEGAELVARRIDTHPEARLALAGYLGPAPEKGEPATSLPRLGDFGDVARVARENGIDRVVLADVDTSPAETEKLIEECKVAGLGLTILPRHYGLLGPGIELNRLAELPVLDFRFSDPPRSTMAIKRAMDLAVSGILLALISPLLLLVALLILVDSGRPVFFRQRRAGKEGDPFTMLKFRTMVPDAEERLKELVDLERLEEPVFKIQDDPRVTRAGRFLRRTSLDELPQLINVFRSDMSLVGPRPEEEAVVALYDERQRVRLAVKPGLTGPMQVYGRGDLTFEERLAMERDYLDNISLTGDLALLIRTPSAIIRGSGAY